ncbi:MAG: sel1 repeat family protein [Oscillospiraceae bacterium]|nr:sel1 repeat family protein [Oscillospiraceae bacterium]
MGYYKPCKEFDECNRLIEEYFKTEQYEKCFVGHLALAEAGYPLAECQVGYFYYDGLGVEKDLPKAFEWTKRAAEHGDRDGQYNLAFFYEEGIGTEADLDMAKYWYQQAAEQNHDLALEKCRELGIPPGDG